MQQNFTEVEMLVTIKDNEIPITTTTLGTVYLTQVFGALGTPFKFRAVGAKHWFNGLVTHSVLERINENIKE